MSHVMHFLSCFYSLMDERSWWVISALYHWCGLWHNMIYELCWYCDVYLTSMIYHVLVNRLHLFLLDVFYALGPRIVMFWLWSIFYASLEVQLWSGSIHVFEVYGIVYVEGIVVASVSWVVVRTYISTCLKTGFFNTKMHFWSAHRVYRIIVLTFLYVDVHTFTIDTCCSYCIVQNTIKL